MIFNPNILPNQPNSVFCPFLFLSICQRCKKNKHTQCPTSPQSVNQSHKQQATTSATNVILNFGELVHIDTDAPAQGEADVFLGALSEFPGAENVLPRHQVQ